MYISPSISFEHMKFKTSKKDKLNC